MNEIDENDWFSIACNIQSSEARKSSWEPPLRIVSYEKYQEAEKAIKDGASRSEIELCLAGGKWPDVKEWANR